MNKLKVILILLTVGNLTFGQTCIHTDLSKFFDFKTELRRIPHVDETYDSCIVTLTIINKITKNAFQKIQLSSTYFFEKVFNKCNCVRSYSTGKNKNLMVIDNDYGDLIIADFNFDSKDDIAVKKDSGGNGGPLYDFYIQNSEGNFIRNKFLSETMEFFPTEINKEKKTLVTFVHANAYQTGESTFKFDTLTKKWKKIRHRLVKAE